MFLVGLMMSTNANVDIYHLQNVVSGNFFGDDFAEIASADQYYDWVTNTVLPNLVTDDGTALTYNKYVYC